MSKIQATFERLQAQGRKALIPFITAGDPDPDMGEAADLLFHLQMLLVSQGFSLQDAALVLRERHRQRT